MIKKKFAGYTLIELSIALVVLGIVLVLVWRFVGFNAQYALSNSERATLRSADEAVTGFVLSNNRLPCPDTNGDGIEDCGGAAAVGQLPFVSIGLAAADANRVRYGVYRNASATPASDADLAVVIDRMPMLTTVGTTPLAGFDGFAGQRNGIDLCTGLRNGANNSPDPGMVHVTASSRNINVAFALAIAGSTDADHAGGLLDAGNAAAGLAFEAPARVTDGEYDDRVVAVGFDRLMGRLGCNAKLAAATHAHANAATMAEITHQAMLDYKIQLDLIKELADANVAAAAAAVAIAASGVTMGLAEISLGLAESLLSLGAAAEVEALAIAASVAAIAATVSAGLNVIPAADAAAAAKANVDDFLDQGFVVRSADLATRIRANANAADAAGVW